MLTYAPTELRVKAVKRKGHIALQIAHAVMRPAPEFLTTRNEDAMPAALCLQVYYDSTKQVPYSMRNRTKVASRSYAVIKGVDRLK